MAYAYVQQAENEILAPATAISTNAFSVGAVKAGNLLVCEIFCISGQTVSSLTDNLGNTYVSAGSITIAGVVLFAFYAKNIAGGTCTATANFSASTADSGIALYEYSGIDRINPFVAYLANGQTNPVPAAADGLTSTNLTPTWIPALLWGCCGPVTGGSAPSAGTGFNGRATVWGAVDTPEDKRVIVSGGVAATWTAVTTGFDHAARAMLFREAPNFLSCLGCGS